MTTDREEPIVRDTEADPKKSACPVVDAFSLWLNSPGDAREESKPLHPSYRMAAEEAVRCFQEIASELNPNEAKEVYIHLLVGRGFPKPAPARKRK